MLEPLLVEAIRATPAALWALFAIIIFLALKDPIRTRLNALSSLRTPGGLEVTFINEILVQAQRENTSERATDGSQATSDASDPATAPTGHTGAAARLHRAAASLAHGRILWADDRPGRTRALTDLFRQAGMVVDGVKTTAAAIERFDGYVYDVVITDHVRDEGRNAGRNLLNHINKRKADQQAPVIVFTDRATARDADTKGFFGCATNSDEVVHYVIDVMERRRLDGA